MATTSFSLGEHWETFIRNEVATGRYGSASEVVHAALRVLDEQEQRLETLRAHLAVGAEQARRGEFVEYSLEDVLAEIDRLTAQARADIGAIGRYTRRVRGRRQAEAYLAANDRRMRWLAEDPLRGRAREDVAPGYPSYPEGTHLVVYMIVGDELAVIGVPHQSMDFRAHFDGAPKR